MRRFCSLLLSDGLLVGCGAESPRQAGARTAVEESLSADYDRDRTKCTDNPSPWLIEQEATVFICAAERNGGGCDWYRATLKKEPNRRHSVRRAGA